MTEQLSQYEQAASDFLTAHNLQFRVVLVGDDCPRFCEDAVADCDMDQVNVFPRRTHIHGKHYRVTFSGEGRGHVGFDFWNSYADEERNFVVSQRHNVGWKKYKEHYDLERKYQGKGLATVSAYDVIACITKDNPGSFEDFCGEFGYDTDSRRAEQTYHAVVEEYKKVARFFTPAEISEMQGIN